MTTKMKLYSELEKHGLGFTANVITNGCGKPCTKMKTILDLIAAGCEVRQAQNETLMVVVRIGRNPSKAYWLRALDQGAKALLSDAGAA